MYIHNNGLAMEFTAYKLAIDDDEYHQIHMLYYRMSLQSQLCCKSNSPLLASFIHTYSRRCYGTIKLF